MEERQINNLAVEYVTTKSEDVFNEMYEALIVKWKPRLANHSKVSRLTYGEILAKFDDSVLKCLAAIERDGGGEIVKLLETSVRNGKYDLMRRSKRRYEMEIYAGKDESEAATFETLMNTKNTYRIEDEIIAKEKPDNRQVIESLLSDADERTTAIIQTFLKFQTSGKRTWDFVTPSQIAKELGVHHSAVTRTFKRLAAKFDVNTFGDYREYLPA